MRRTRNVAVTVGILLVVTLLLYRLVIPAVNSWALTATYDHTAGDVQRAYLLRIPPLLAIYFCAGAACSFLVEAQAKLWWALLAVGLAVAFAVLFQSVSLSGRVPFRHEIELRLPILVPLVGVALGSLATLLWTRRGRQTI